MAIIRLNEFEALPDQVGALKTFLESVVEIVKAAPGCVSCQLLQKVDDSAQFVILEQWGSVESHQSAVSKIPPEQFRQAMALLAKPPAGSYYQ